MSTCYCENCIGPEKTEQLHEAATDLLIACEKTYAMLCGLTSEEFAHGADKESRDLLESAIRKAHGWREMA